MLIVLENVERGLSDTRTPQSQGRAVLAPVVRVNPTVQKALFLQKFDLSADAGFGLAETDGNLPLLSGGVVLQRAEDLVLREANAKLLL